MNCIIAADQAAMTGGISTVILAQAEELRARGHEVHLFAGEGPASERLDRICSSVVCLIPKKRERNRLQEIWNMESKNRFSAYLRGFRQCDTVVHIHSISMRLSSSIAYPLNKSRFPYYITAHDPSWACPTGVYYDRRLRVLCDVEPLSARCLVRNCTNGQVLSKGLSVAKSLALHKVSALCQNAKCIIAPSKTMLCFLTNSKLPVGRLTYLPNPTEERRREAVSGPSIGFVFVGRLVEEKGPVEFLTAARVAGVKANIVGDGPMLKQLMRDFPEAAFYGWRSHKETLDTVARATALVMPNLHLEAFGLVAAEALALGVPAIVSRHAGASEIIVDDVNGLLIDPNDPRDLASALTRLADAQVRARLARNCVQTLGADQLTRKQYGDRLLSIFGRSQTEWLEGLVK